MQINWLSIASYLLSYWQEKAARQNYQRQEVLTSGPCTCQNRSGPSCRLGDILTTSLGITSSALHKEMTSGLREFLRWVKDIFGWFSMWPKESLVEQIYSVLHLLLCHLHSLLDFAITWLWHSRSITWYGRLWADADESVPSKVSSRVIDLSTATSSRPHCRRDEPRPRNPFRNPPNSSLGEWWIAMYETSR